MTLSSFSLKTATAILSLLLLQTSLFALAVKPIKGISIVVKKNPGTSAEKKAVTDDEGNFQMKLTRGSYQLILPEQQILRTINAVNETGKTIAGKDLGLDAVTCALTETEGIKFGRSEAIDGNVYATMEVTVAEATISGTLTSDHAINEQGLPGSGSGPKPKKEKPHIKITFGTRTAQPNGKNDSDPFPPKQNRAAPVDHAINTKGTGHQDRQVGKDKGFKGNYVGHPSLIKRTINPESGGQPNMETFTLTNKLPGENQKIIFYEIKTINIPGFGKTQLGNMAVAYQFFTANGKTYAVPSLLFDLPNPPSDIQLQLADFSSSASRVAKPTSSGSEISFNPSTQQCDLSYQAMVGGKTAMVQMSLTEIATTMSNNPTQSSYWCGVSTKCGPVFAVLVTNGTPCGNVNSFFNKVCDGLRNE